MLHSQRPTLMSRGLHNAPGNRFGPTYGPAGGPGSHRPGNDQRHQPPTGFSVGGLLLGGVRLLAVATLALLTAMLLSAATLRWLNPPLTAYMLGHQSQARELGQSDAIDYRWVDAGRIADSARHAVIAAEDPRFYQHNGFDFEAIRANLLPGEQRQNVSSLSQQLARNLFLWSERSWLRKLLEAMVTVVLEISCPKERILTLYLNTAEFGHGIFGVESAAQHFFQLPASELSRQQAAALAAVLPYPGRWDPVEPEDAVAKRVQHIQRRMDELFPPR